jgi:hypothetical protein
MLPVATGSYSSLYYKDYFYTGTGFALVGGASYHGSNAGAFCVHLAYEVGTRYWNFAAAPSLKPCLKG